MNKSGFSLIAATLTAWVAGAPASATTWDFDGVITGCNPLACTLAGITTGQAIGGFLRADGAVSGPGSTFGAADIEDYGIAAQGVTVGPGDSTIVAAQLTTDGDGELDTGSIEFFGEFDGGDLGTIPLEVTIDITAGNWIVSTTTLGIGEVASGPGNWTLEPDGDDLASIEDNCTMVFNPAQRDTDGDGIGNNCDPDFDQNCFVNFLDLNTMSANFFVAGDLDTDLNGDGQTNFGDLFVMRDLFFAPPGPSGVTNNCEI